MRPDCSSTTTSAEPEEFERGLAAAVNELVRDPDRAAAMGRAGRQRAIDEFGWDVAAQRTVDLYRVAGAQRLALPTYVRNPNPYGNSGS